MVHSMILLMVLALALGIGSIAVALRYRALYRLEFITHLVVFLVALNAAALIGVFFNYFGANLEQQFSAAVYRGVDIAYRLAANVILLAVGGSLVLMLHALVDREPSRRYLVALLCAWTLLMISFVVGIWLQPPGLPMPLTVLANVALDQIVQYLVLFESLRAWRRCADLASENRRRWTRRFLLVFGSIWLCLIAVSVLMFTDLQGNRLYNLFSAVVYVILNALPLTLLGLYLRGAFGPPAEHGDEPRSALDRLAEQHGLSSRELEVARLVCRGYPNKQVAEELFISLSTVKDHNHNIFRKLGVKSRAQLIALAAGNRKDV